MVSVAVVVPVRDGVPALGTPETICEALDAVAATSSCRVVLVGTGTSDAAAGLGEAGFADVAFLLAETRRIAFGAWAAGLAGIVEGDRLVLLPGSVDGRDLGPRIAAELRRPFVAGATTVDFGHVVVPRASGRALIAAALSGPTVVTLQPGARDAERTPQSEPVTPVVPADFTVPEDRRDATVIEVSAADAATVDLAEASFILGAGIGLGAQAAVEDLRVVAAALDASVGGTRVVTDEEWLAHERQIGTTGVVVDPSTYVAFGISGAVQHTSGLGSPEHVISVNTDAHCPMMQRSDLAIVSDAPAVVAELRRRLGAHGEPGEEVS